MKNFRKIFSILTLILMSFGINNNIFSQGETFSTTPVDIGGTVYICAGGNVIFQLSGTHVGDVYRLIRTVPGPSTTIQNITATSATTIFDPIQFVSTGSYTYALLNATDFEIIGTINISVVNDPTAPILNLSQATGTVCAGPTLSASLNMAGSDGNPNVPGSNSYDYRIDEGTWIPYGLGDPISTTTYMLSKVEIRAKRSNDDLGCSAENIYTWNIESNVHDITGTQGSYCTIQQAIDASSTAPGDVLQIESGTHQLTGIVNVNKSVILEGLGVNNTIIEMSSSWFNSGATAFTCNSPGIIIRDIHFKIVGKGQGNIIGIFQSNTEIRNNKFSGEYVYGDGEVTRATVWSASPVTGIVMDNNIIESLRQPGYISGGSGVISNNTFTTTRGWVIEGVQNLNITGNTWNNNTSHITILTNATNISGLTINNNNLSGAKVDWVIDNRTPNVLNASCNWFGTTDYVNISSKNSGPIVFVPYLYNATIDPFGVGYSCTGVASPLNLSVIYEPIPENIQVTVTADNNDLNLLAIPGNPTLPQITTLYTNLATAVTAPDIQAAALAVGDDVIMEYYYYNYLNVKTYLQTAGLNPLIKNKYWQEYLVKLSNPLLRYPNWAAMPTPLTVIDEDETYRTNTNPGTGAVASGWLNGALGRNVYVTASFIHNGNVSSATQSVAIPAGPVNVYNAEPFSPATWVSSHLTIQAAINEASTINGYFVKVDAGTYNENVTVSKAINLRGANFGTAGCASRVTETVVAGGAGSAFTITSNGVTIDGFEMTGLYGVSSTGFTNLTIRNNKIATSGAGISATSVVTSAGNTLTVEDNCIDLNTQEVSGTPTIGVYINGVSGTDAIVMDDNTVTDGFYGYVLNGVNTTVTSIVSDGLITGVLQGVAVVNTVGGPLVGSNLTVSGMNMSGFIGTSSNPASNFHAGVYTFTAGPTIPSNGITLAVNNCTIDGTLTNGPASAAVYLGDFSSGGVAVQDVTIDECTITDNRNRGVDARGYVNATVTESTFTGNGSAPHGSDGNDGYTMLAQRGATITASNNFITHPLTSTHLVTAFRTGNSPTNSIIAMNNKIDINGNANGRGGSTGTGSITATCNWWGSIVPATNAALMTGSVTYIPWLTNGMDGMPSAGFQPAIPCSTPCTLVLGSSKNDPTCFGANDGSATVNISSGGVAPYTYLWSNSGNTVSISPLAPSTYTVTVTNANGCTATTSTTIVETPVLNATVNKTDVTCNGANDGTITITSPTGGYGTYEYSINGGSSWQSTGSYTGLANATYDVRIRDEVNPTCVITLNGALVITQPNILSASLASTNVTCNGANDGTITITSPTGGYGTYEYRLNAGAWQGSGSFTGLSASTYNVQIRDAANIACVIVLGNQTIGQPAALTATVSSTNVTCFGGTNGSATVTPSGGTGPYTYSWAGYTTGITLDGQNGWNGGNPCGGFVNNNAGDTYVVNAESFSGNNSWYYKKGYSSPGCGTPFTPVVASVGAPGNGAVGNQSIVEFSFKSATPSDASAMSLYEGSLNRDDRTGAQINIRNIGGGLVEVFMSKAIAGSPYFQTEILGTYPANVWHTVKMITDYPVTSNIDHTTWGTTQYFVDGVLVSTQTPWTHWWRFKNNFAYAPGSSLKFAANNLGDGFYIDDVSMIVNNTISNTTIASFGSGFESAPANVDGSTTNLAASVYGVKVTDANGCSVQASVDIDQPDILNATVASVNVSCNGANNGSITISSPTGGLGTYQYQLNNLGWMMSGSFSGLTPGSYSVQIRDAAVPTCIIILNPALVITQPDVLMATASSDSPIYAGSTLNLSSNVSGGTMTYNYSWTGPDGFVSTDANPSITNATVNANGIYNVTVTDMNGCIASTSTSAIIYGTSLYVNDNSTSGDVYTTAVGSDTNPGTAVAPFATITKAITVALAGNTIYVDAGTYAENITVGKGLDIRGPNYNVSPNTGIRLGEAIIVPASTNTATGAVVTITSGSFSFRGFTVDGDNTSLASSGVGLGGALGTSIDAARTIFLQGNGLNGVNISENITKNAVNGIRIEQTTNYLASGGPAGAVRSTNIVINENKVQDITSTGIRLGNSMYAKVTNNTVSNADNGIAFSSFRISDAGSASDRVISGNTISARFAGIWVNLFHASPYAITNNTITPAAAATSMAPTPQSRTAWYGIMYSTVSAPQNFTNQTNLPQVATPEWWTSTNNNIDGAALESTSTGYGYWMYYVDNNRDNLGVDHYGQISGGSVSNVDVGIMLKNRDTDPSTNFGTAAVGAHANVSGVSFSLRTGGTGLRMIDDATWTTSNPAPLLNKRTVALGIGSGVSISGGATGINISHPVAGTTNYTAYNSITSGALSDISFSTQSGDYITLANHPNGLDGTAASFGGPTGSSATTAQNYTIEDKISHMVDNSTRGLVRVKASNIYVTTTSGSVQRGIDAATGGDIVNVDAGTYEEYNINVNKSVTIRGANAGVACTGIRGSESIIQNLVNNGLPVFNVTADGVTLNGLEIINPWGNSAVDGSGRSNLSIIFNNIHNVGTSRGSGNIYALRYLVGSTNTSNVTISDNCISNVANTTIALGNTGGIWFGQSTSDGIVNSLTIERNTISNINAKSDKGAWGITIGTGSGAGLGSIAAPVIRNNNITAVTGGYSSAIDLTGKTPNAVVSNNFVNNINSSGVSPFSAGVTVGAANTGSTTLAINDNSFTNVLYGITNGNPGAVNGTCNWYGSASGNVVAPKILGNVNYISWLVNGTNNASGTGFFQTTPDCSGTPVFVTSAIPSPNQFCQNDGEVEVEFNGGTGTYTVAWTGGTPVSGITGSPYTITGLTNGNYTITVTDINGTWATINATVSISPVRRTSVGPVYTYYTNIQNAINAAVAGEVIDICAGTYTETININKALTINGPNVGISGTGVRVAEAVLLNCSIDISNAGNTTLDGLHILRTDVTSGTQLALDGGGVNTVQNCIFERTGPTPPLNGAVDVWALSTTTAGGNKIILNNKITGDATGGVFGNHKSWARGIYIDQGAFTVNISGNTFENCRTGLNVDDFNNNVTISGNTINNNGTHISLGGSTPTVGTFILGSNDFINNTSSTMINCSNVAESFRLDITSSKLNGTVFSALSNASLFEVEARMAHKEVSPSKKGKVTYVAGNQYLNNFTVPATKIDQINNGIKYADAPEIINLQSGTYNQKVVIDKSNLTLKGITSDKTLYIISGTTITSSGTPGSGIVLNNGITGTIIQNLTVENFTGTNGNSHAGIYGVGGNNSTTVTNVALLNNPSASGFYANGPVDDVEITFSMVANNGGDARGIVIWNGLKTNINISNNMVTNNTCCGIELQDGTASGVTISDNTIDIQNGDNALGINGLRTNIGNNLISDNMITGGGRFGIEIKNPSDNDSGPNTTTVSGNNVNMVIQNGETRDRAGIAVFRRFLSAGNPDGHPDAPNGVIISGNTVIGYQQASVSEGFGIVVEGENHTVTGNTLTNNDIAIQQQAGHTPFTTNVGIEGDQSNISDIYFGRGNSPTLCNVTLSGNIYSGNTVNERIVTGGGTGIIQTAITPTVDPVANQTLCVGQMTTAVNFTGNNLTGVVYNWTNTNTSIGLAASGSGNISTFTGLNTTGVVQTATIEVTPVVNGCEGTPEVFTISVQPTPVVSATVMSPVSPSQIMTSGAGPYIMTICSGQEVTTSDAISISIDPSVCGPLMVQTTYITDISTLPNTLQTFNAPVGPDLGITSITPENHDGMAKDIVFVSTPYYDVDGSMTLTAGDVLGLPINFTLTVQPTPKVNFTVTADGTPIPMQSGVTGTSASYTATICSGELVTSTAAFSSSAAPGACGPLMIQTSYTTSIGNIFPQVYTAYGPFVGNVAPAPITPQNLDAVPKDIVFTTTPYYEVDGTPGLTAGDVVGDYPVIFTLTVQPAPRITCPPNVTVNNGVGVCNAVVMYNSPTFTDFCATSSIVQIAGLASGSIFPVGVTTNTWQITDGAIPANTAICSFMVTVIDNEPPTNSIPAMGASIAGYTCGGSVSRYTDLASCNSFQTIMKPVWVDNCSITSTSATATNGVILTDLGAFISGTFPKGNTIVTFTATDAQGNISTCSVTIEVSDNIAPVFSSLPLSFSVAAPPGDCSLIVNWVPPVANDNCPGTVSVTSNFSPGTAFDVPNALQAPFEYTVTYTATDQDGNAATYSFNITVTGSCIPAVDLSVQAPNFALDPNPLVGFTLPIPKDGVVTIKNNGINASHELAPLGNIKVLVSVPSYSAFTTFGELSPENDDWIVTEYPSSPAGVKMYLFTLKPTLTIAPTASKTIRIRITPVGYIGQKGIISAQLYNGSGGDISPSNNYTQGSFQIAN